MKRRVLSLLLTVVMAFSLIPANIGTKEIEVKADSTGRRVVGYFPSYRISTLNSIDFSALTHCMLSFMTYSNGTLTPGFNAGDVQTIVSKCHANGVKAIIAIGGWNGFDTSDNPFGTAEKRTSFVNQVMNYVDTYNLDGVDLDIEVSDANVWNNFDALVSELSGRLKSEGKLLTMAVSTWFTGSIANSTYQYFDFLNLMSYDYNQTGTADHAPWSQIYDMVSYYSSRGVSNDKLVIGVPFYGYGTGGAVTYAEMVAAGAANANLDYANGVYYNGMSTIRQKAEYSKSYGGTMIWEIGQDSFGTYSLLNVIKEVMASGDTGETTTAAQETTTQPSATVGPEEVFGELISSNNAGYIDVVWGAASNGQTYNVYMDGSIATDVNGTTLSSVGCATYSIPASAGTHTIKITAVLNGQESAGVSQQVTVAGTGTEVTTTEVVETTQAADGYTTASGGWNDLSYWSVYFAPNWGGNPTGSYKAGSSYNDFSMKVNTASGEAWGIQMKTQEMSVEAGKTYICKVNVNSNVSTTSQIRFKEDKTQTETFKSLNAGSNTFELQFTASDTAQIFFDLGLAPVGLEFTVTSFSLEKVEEETTEAPTTAENTSAKLEINGYQISTTVEGYRVVYSLSDTKSEVASVGMVYGLDNYSTESEMVVGSTNSTVYSMEATEAGKLSDCYSSMTNAQSYAMTMEFVKTAEFFNQKVNVRAYAKLNTGEYIYSDVCQLVVYDVADYLYQNNLMNTVSGHNYLFDEILTLVNPSYESLDYKFSNSLVKS